VELIVRPPVMAAAEAIAPTERSIVPDMMRKATGIAISPSSLACMRMFCALPNEKKLGRRIEKTAMRTISARKMPFLAAKILRRSVFMAVPSGGLRDRNGGRFGQ
jgi:hypothetical protein